MTPEMLSRACHYEKRTGWEINRLFERRVEAMSKMKGSCRTKRDTGNNRISSQLFFVVAVPTHAILSEAVEIEQARIELNVAERFNSRFDCKEFESPGNRFVLNIGVFVSCAYVSMPRSQSRNRYLFSIELDRFGLPLYPLLQKSKVEFALFISEKIWEESDFSVWHGEISGVH